MLYQQLASPHFLLLEVGDIFRLFGAFMMVLIAIEIFICFARDTPYFECGEG